MNHTAFKYFLRFIISSIVIIELKNFQKLSKLIILSRIGYVILQIKIAAAPNFGPKLRAG